MSKHPVDCGPKPPFPKQGPQSHPGIELDMDPYPDHGEDTYDGSNKLLGKVALITGGDSGIGKAVALAFAREGAKVVISYLNEHDDADDIESLIRDENEDVLLLSGDISDQEHCKNLVAETVKSFGKIDILVNNAAMGKNRKSILNIPEKEWHQIFDVNLHSIFYLCKAAIPHMEPGSSIINVASVEAFEPDPNALAYSTTKGAIVTFSKSLARELAKQNGIRVNCICPGPFWTPLGTTTMPKEKIQNYGHQTYLGRPGQPKELAPLFVLLASDEASYFVGETFVVAGGYGV